MIFLGNTLNRDKVNVIIADRVVPKQSAERYLDKDAFENEIRQVLGRASQSFPHCWLIVYQCIRTVHARRILLPGLATRSHFSLHLSRFCP